MSKLNINTVAALLLSLSAFAAADENAAMDKPYLYTSSTSQVTAIVEAIDHETREVTVKKPDGEIVTFTASEEARNLDQVSVGDLVHAKYVETMEIEVMANDGHEPAAGGVATLSRTDKGDMPGMVAVDSQIITATVEAINLEANTFKLKGPLGNVTEHTARDPENLKRAAVGDLVIITTTEALAVSVEKGPVE